MPSHPSSAAARPKRRRWRAAKRGTHGAGHRLVDEKVDGGFAVVDGVAVVAVVVSDEAGAVAVVKAPHGRDAPPAGAEHRVQTLAVVVSEVAFMCPKKELRSIQSCQA